MKMIKYIVYLLLAVISLTSCKDLMRVRNEEKLSGDEFWAEGSEADVEAFALSMFGFFRQATMMDAAFFVNTGDLRAAPVVPYNTSENHYVRRLTANSLNQLISDQGNYLGINITRWSMFYRVVQSANMLLENIEIVPGLSEQKIQEYRLEAIFMRNLTYFMLARVFGDVVYYTEPLNQVSLPRSNMVEVLRLCLADLQTILDEDPDYLYMPWVQSGAKMGIRPNRGSVLLLMMHINMWLARFDTARSASYYEQAANLGQVLVEDNGESYYLLDINRSPEIFRGGSAETLFEIAQNINTGEIFTTGLGNGSANFSNLVTYKYTASLIRPIIYYQADFLQRLFPPDETDGRREAWFDENIYQIDGSPKEIIKFLQPDVSGDSPTSNAGNQIVFRYADAILLYAEALVESNGSESRALELLNMVRERAGAAAVASSGDALRDDIYWERTRELIGEGQYFYDLVRTGKIHDPAYCYHTISRSNFNQGAWTWPIHPDAFLNNTRMTYNLFWR